MSLGETAPEAELEGRAIRRFSAAARSSRNARMSSRLSPLSSTSKVVLLRVREDGQWEVEHLIGIAHVAVSKLANLSDVGLEVVDQIVGA